MAVIRCSRCGGESIVSSETFGTEGWLERNARSTLARNPFVDPRDADPRFGERRR